MTMWDVLVGDPVAYRLHGITGMRHEPQPWTYPPDHLAYARDWPYTLLVYAGGFKQRIYDWEGPIVRVKPGAGV